ncbi:hypothetical protein V6Z05_19920 [Leptospira venezuelensis]|uniref:hypothetical protein n=1 Tax=Leptospira venezuelensis TaxID=1958811 RepID=UPI000A3BD36F|nr:hypothetical protein [Leptospira venezuelensis]
MNELEQILQYISKVFAKKLHKPKSFANGEEYEEFVREVLFPKDIYNLLHKTHNYDQNSKDYVEDSLLPDYKFKDTDLNIEFYVECKYRNITKILDEIENLINEFELKKRTEKEKVKLNADIKRIGTIDFISKNQYARFLELNIKNRVLICLGLFYEKTENIYPYIFPIEDLILNRAHIYDLENYIVPNNYPFVPDRVVDLFYNKDSFCIECQKRVMKKAEQPLCRGCHLNWFKNSDFKLNMKYCHSCGKDCITSVARPDCLECYKKNINAIFEI